MRKSPVSILFFLALGTVGSEAQTFSAPVKFTDSAGKYQMSRTSSHMMAFDSAGTLHLAYWSGGSVTIPSLPSYVYHRTWTAVGGWGAQEEVDDSEQAGEHVGGRHPSMAVLPDNTVWIVWHDHRHGTPVGSWIDNIEIYGDFKPPLGSFSSADIRLTTSAGVGSGLNGYTPRIAANPAGGVVSVSWYDFEADGNISDIYLKASDVLGGFNLSESWAAMRATNETSRGGTPAYTVPDMAVDSLGTRHMVWTGGIGSDVSLYYAAAAAGTSAVAEISLGAGVTDFFDPPHVVVASNDDVWIAYADDTLANNENIAFLRRRSGQPGFDPVFTAKSGSAREYSVDHAVDAVGKMHFVWVDERSGRHIYYGRYDPATTTLETEVRLTSAGGNWIRPAILMRNGEAYVVYEQDTNPLNAGDLWFTTTFNPNSVPAGQWMDYE